MKTKLYRVETTFVGADKKSKLYFDNRKKAQDFLYDFCTNGCVEIVEIESSHDLNYSDGCTMNDLTYGDFDAVEKVLEYDEFEETVETIRTASNYDEVRPELDFIMEEAGLSDEWKHADGDNFEDIIREAQNKLNIDLGL